MLFASLPKCQATSRVKEAWVLRVFMLSCSWNAKLSLITEVEVISFIKFLSSCELGGLMISKRDGLKVARI